MIKTKAIIWDWNGTLLDDIDICIEGINELLKARNKQEINRSKYRDIFTFPVIEYYKKAGFDFSNEPFDIPALQFIDFYKKKIRDASLFPKALDTLKYFHQRNIKQVILSAMESDFLNETINDFGIRKYFSLVQGIDDHYANSKHDKAKTIIQYLNLNPEEIILVGDTMHDLEIGKKLGVRMIMAGYGHQSPDHFPINSCIIINSIIELKEYI